MRLRDRAPSVDLCNHIANRLLVGPVLAGETLQLSEPGLDLLQASGPALPFTPRIPQGLGQVLERKNRFFGPCESRRRRGIIADQLPRRGEDPVQACQSGSFPLVEALQRQQSAFADLLLISRPDSLGPQRFRFSRSHHGALDLLHLEFQNVDPAGGLLAVAGPGVQPGADPADLRVQRRKAVAGLPVVAGAVQDRQVLGGPKQRLVLVLSVKIDEAASESAEIGHRGEVGSDEGPAPAPGDELAPQRQLPLLGLPSPLFEIGKEIGAA